MKPELFEYLQRQISLGRERLLKYVVSPSGVPYPTRNIYIKTNEYLTKFLAGGYEGKCWVIVAGLRGTGKTTLLAQTHAHLARQQGQVNVLYFSLDEAMQTVGSSLQEVLSAYERILGENFESLAKPTVLLIDEVQSDPAWAGVLKSLNDRAKNLFLICSGSSAIHLQDNADVSGRRAFMEKLYPLNFCEYIMIRRGNYPDKGLKNLLKDALYQSDNAEDCFKKLQALQPRVEQYWSKVGPLDWQHYLGAGNLPYALVEKNLQAVYDSILTSVDKIVTNDIQQLGKFTLDTIPAIKRMLFILAESDAISNIKLAQALGLNPLTVANILETLAQAELLIRVPPRGAQINAARKPSKYLFMSPAIRAAYYNIAGSASTSDGREGRLLEDLVGMHFYREFTALGRGSITYDSSIGGADFILQLPTSQIVVEVGKGHKGGRQIENTMKNIDAKYGLVFCSNSLGLTEAGTGVIVPLQFYALA